MFKNNLLNFLQDGYKANDSEIWIKDDSNRTKPIGSTRLKHAVNRICTFERALLSYSLLIRSGT